MQETRAQERGRVPTHFAKELARAEGGKKTRPAGVHFFEAEVKKSQGPKLQRGEVGKTRKKRTFIGLYYPTKGKFQGRGSGMMRKGGSYWAN